jgi:FkbM family methyltransferase
VEFVTEVLREIHAEKARPIIAHDLGANIGCHSLVWARALENRVTICAVEAQPRIFQMLCGNIALNNRFEITPLNAAIGGQDGEITFPVPDYDTAATFGSLELRGTHRSENIGQDLSESDTVTVALKTLSALQPGPSDFIKLDIEGMEEEALLTQEEFLDAHRPVVFCEHIKSNARALTDGFKRIGFQSFVVGINLLFVRPESRLMETVIAPRLQRSSETSENAVRTA